MGRTYDEVFQNILEKKIKFPHYVESEAVNLIKKLLEYSPESRLGLKNFKDIREHPYFKNINFEQI